MGTILAIFSGPLGSILTKLIEGLFIVGTLAGLYFSIQHQAKTQQKLEDQKVILEQVIKDQKDFIDKSSKLQQDMLDASNALTANISTIQSDTDRINKYLSDPNVIKNDRQTSDIIKEVIKQLSGGDK